MPRLLQGCIAEFLGVFALVFFGAGAIIVTTTDPGSGAGLLTVAAAHAIALIVFISGLAHVSGAQFNPAVSVALIAAGKQDVPTTLAYIVAQLIAGASAAGMLVAILGADVANSDAARLGATIGSLTLAGDAAAVFALEAILTFALMFSILWCLVDDRPPRLGGFPVGLTVGMCILAAGPYTGASMNPARTFGPAVYGHWNMHAIYWLAPIVGAVAAALLYRFVFAPQRSEAPR